MRTVCHKDAFPGLCGGKSELPRNCKGDASAGIGVYVLKSLGSDLLRPGKDLDR